MADRKKPKFPLPRGYFGEVNLTKQQHEYYREFCANQVQRGLLDERRYWKGNRQVDATKWKPVRSQHTFQLFRRRDGGLHENDGKPSMLGLGRVEGSIEDVLYGAYDQTDEELRMTAELVDVDFGDGIVLSNMEQGSSADPYRYLGIKWILTPFPMPALMPDRDWVLLESMDISTDASGRRYGYHTLFTIEMPHCRPFPEVIRGSMWYTFIYRDAGRGMLDVYSQGYFDCLGELLDPITVIGSSQMFNGVFRYMKSAEAKKLTILALENLENKIATGHQQLMADKVHIPPNATCSVCTKSKSANPFSSRRMRVCGVCDAFVCLSCRVKKNILVGRQRVQCKVSVCQKCIAHAKTLIVHPSEEKFVISREMQVGDFSTARTTGSSTSLMFQPMSGGSGQYHLYGGNNNNGITRNHRGSSRSRTTTPKHVDRGYYGGGGYGGGYSEQSNEGYDALRGSRSGSGDRSGGGMTPHAAPPAALYATDSIKSTKPQRVVQPPPPPPSAAQESEENEVQQQALFKRMQHLQDSAKRAHDLTEANRMLMMNETP